MPLAAASAARRLAQAAPDSSERRQSLRAVVGDRQRMLELGRAFAVGGADRPGVLVQFRLWAALVEHRLDGKDHTGANLRASAWLANVGDKGIFVQRAPDAVATILAHHAVALALGVLLDGGADVADAPARLRLRDAEIEALLRRVE